MAKKQTADVVEPAVETPDPAPAVTESFMADIFKSTKEALHAQPKFTVRLRKDPQAKPGFDTALVQINGYTYRIMRGIDVEVPQTVRDILIEAGEI